ncbi:MAG: hypothetical protein EON54_10225 [Alcaligenaceae bacterium]|nr:MAG: hypothetical protein EON54_10225 [Alcaligenaceae bacterium]
MKVIRHGEEETAVKIPFALPAPDRIEDSIPYLGIRKLVDAENRAKPLSDNQITKKLAEHGIVIARRTVAKYRESLRIAPAALRRAHAAAK